MLEPANRTGGAGGGWRDVAGWQGFEARPEAPPGPAHSRRQVGSLPHEEGWGPAHCEPPQRLPKTEDRLSREQRRKGSRAGAQAQAIGSLPLLQLRQ